MSDALTPPPAAYLDEEQVFLLYATFCGDIPKTAHAADRSKAEVAAMVSANGWEERVRGLVELKKGDKAGEVERSISRAVNFCQAHRLRFSLEKVIRRLSSMDLDEMFKLFMSEKVNKMGEVTGQALSFKPLADLTAALEKVHWMTYSALCDLPQDRAKRKVKDDDDVSETDIHARISKAMSELRSGSPKALLEAGQAEMAAHIASAAPGPAPTDAAGPSPAQVTGQSSGQAVHIP